MKKPELEKSCYAVPLKDSVPLMIFTALGMMLKEEEQKYLLTIPCNGPFKGTVSRDFLYSVFSPKQLLLDPLEMS